MLRGAAQTPANMNADMTPAIIIILMLCPFFLIMLQRYEINRH
jgi:hypothetical protein